MDTEFEFLRRFESELAMRAKADARREASPKPKDPRRWKPWVAVAAILLLLAAGIGVLANSGLSGSQASMAATGTDTGAARNPGALVPAPSPATNQGGLTFGSYHQNQSVRGGVGDLPGVKAGIDTTATSAPNVQQEGANGSSSNAAP